VETPTGFRAFEALPEDTPFEIVNTTGTHLAALVTHKNYAGWMIELAPGKLVTLGHLMRCGCTWAAAEVSYHGLKRVWYEGTVYNIHVLSPHAEDHHSRIFNRDLAHNLKIAPS
jgi:hypothetical protein